MNKEPRTTVDFSKHELTIIKNDEVLIHHLKKPDTMVHNVKFINCHGILAVTGDYGNWIFCREFHPSPDGNVSDGYWCEKLQIGSKQNPYVFDSRETKKQIQEYLDNAEDYGYDDEETQNYLNECKSIADCTEQEYDQLAYGNMPLSMCAEDVPKAKTPDYSLLVIFDAFEEVCRLIKGKKQ